MRTYYMKLDYMMNLEKSVCHLFYPWILILKYTVIVNSELVLILIFFRSLNCGLPIVVMNYVCQWSDNAVVEQNLLCSCSCRQWIRTVSFSKLTARRQYCLSAGFNIGWTEPVTFLLLQSQSIQTVTFSEEHSEGENIACRTDL